MFKNLYLIARSEVVSLYVSANIVLLNLNLLGVHWLTDTRQKAILAISDVVLGAVVRALVTPTPLTPPMPASVAPVPGDTHYSAPPGAVVGAKPPE